MQLYYSAQTLNIIRLKITSILYEKELNWGNSMCLDYHNEVKIALRFKFSIDLRKKKFCIFQGLLHGPLDPKLTALPLDHKVSSELRKKMSGHYSLCNANLVMAGNSKI